MLKQALKEALRTEPARQQDWRNAVRALNQAKAKLMDAATYLT